MSMTLNFEPHSWYKGAAIKQNRDNWEAVLLNGMTGHIIDFEDTTLQALKEQIKTYVNNEKARVARLYQKASK